ncbi:NAD binding domain of 6-phosphogluconate dehydrogenase-domain-containing protein [Myxozyma melibiosi]|uniref:NAD binding domain of 6-phosphogluconate dehydrogenase-domain-containing protein n=1 Tax=Myxozyma melibiosi TaxID=54550 RepID=A0ABR1F383_9ASCO
MASNLISKGNLDPPLLLWNRSAEKAKAFAEGKSVTLASSLEEAVAKADIIFSCISNDAAVESVYETALKIPDGVKGKIFAECSTIHPDTTRGLEKATKAAGGLFVAAPVFGAPAMANAGMLVFVLAGSKAGIESIKPYLDGVMGRMSIDLSDDPDVGKALTLKVIGNTVILGMVESLSEGHVLSEKTGLGTENFEKFITAMFGQSPYLPYSKRLTGGDYVRDKPLFGADLAAKDARHALSLAKSSGTTMPIVEIAAQHLKEVEEELGPKGDIASIYGVVRKKAGLPFIEKK